MHEHRMAGLLCCEGASKMRCFPRVSFLVTAKRFDDVAVALFLDLVLDSLRYICDLCLK